MKFYIKSKKNGLSAVGEYDFVTRTMIVQKGAVVSEKISDSPKFRGAKSIERARADVIKNRVLLKDITFKSASTAATFIFGGSRNGLIAWKDENGKTIQDYISEEEVK